MYPLARGEKDTSKNVVLKKKKVSHLSFSKHFYIFLTSEHNKASVLPASWLEEVKL